MTRTISRIMAGCALAVAVLATAACASAPKQERTSGAPEASLIDLISSGNTAEVKKRFSSSVAINQKNAQGQSLLHIAALRNDSEMVQLLLAMKADPEITLHKACGKFTDRFRLVEKEVLESGKPWSEFSLEELDGFWEKAKRQAGNRQAVGKQ